MPEMFDVLAKGAMRLSADKSQDIDGNWVHLDAFDNTVVERGGIICDPAAGSITVAEDAFYVIHMGLNIFCSQNAVLDARGLVNGVPYDERYFSVWFRGVGKPNGMIWVSHADFNAGDVITLEGRRGDAAPTITLEYWRTAFVVKKDS